MVVLVPHHKAGEALRRTAVALDQKSNGRSYHDYLLVSGVGGAQQVTDEVKKGIGESKLWQLFDPKA